ncbi:MAG: phage terminase small subunit P27 family [Liquorilactobacillus nagelii]|jgi:P27 family predicted phage terminase small subunit|uniref:phage terminase small subunit P27 family n=1 Tax=Liquorilactobacillus nagelii TaxID=82688 RepID=UPI00243182DB|nr:phage terminase small subunit P27 family [Liquorilactobacillus nagelii]MCI1633694.1 phage terminase small subunit P27 family [Liquorilactobacillus nagelii]
MSRNIKLLKDIKSHLNNEEIAQRKDMETALFNYPQLKDDPPDWLKGRALTEWKRVVPYLKANTPISELDRGLLADYCRCYSIVQTCETDITKHGLVLTNKETGIKKKNPYYEIMSQAMKDMKMISVELGMTINSRAKMELNKQKQDKPKDEFEALLDG